MAEKRVHRWYGLRLDESVLCCCRDDFPIGKALDAVEKQVVVAADECVRIAESADFAPDFTAVGEVAPGPADDLTVPDSASTNDAV